MSQLYLFCVQNHIESVCETKHTNFVGEIMLILCMKLDKSVYSMYLYCITNISSVCLKQYNLVYLTIVQYIE